MREICDVPWEKEYKRYWIFLNDYCWEVCFLLKISNLIDSIRAWFNTFCTPFPMERHIYRFRLGNVCQGLYFVGQSRKEKCKSTTWNVAEYYPCIHFIWTTHCLKISNLIDWIRADPGIESIKFEIFSKKYTSQQ